MLPFIFLQDKYLAVISGLVEDDGAYVGYVEVILESAPYLHVVLEVLDVLVEVYSRIVHLADGMRADSEEAMVGIDSSHVLLVCFLDV